ncbi:MAG: hypothetical protein ABSG82_02310 [Sedimentisphaerales bacterium]
MDTLRPQHVSVIDPIRPAIEHVRLMLFKPFDISKWLTVGFCAWLAYLGEGSGGSGFNYSMNDHNTSVIKDHIFTYLPLIIIGVVIAIPIFIIIGLVLCWLRSRSQFMFVHCIAGNKAEVVAPWNKFAGQGNSLFLFRVVVGLIGFAVVGLPLAIAVVATIALHQTGLVAGVVSGLLVAVLGVVGAAILFILIAKLTTDFVVPIMFLRTTSCIAGWREFLVLLSCNKARIAFYILFQIMISLAIFFVIITVCVIGCCCCCASLLLFVPYVGTVILLPIFVFKRAYSLFYLRQFGAQFDVFSGQVL